MFGTGELLLILGAVLVLFGGKKLPEFARNLGMGIRELKKPVTGKKIQKSPKKSRMPTAPTIMSKAHSLASFWDHLEELRIVIIRSFFFVACGTLISFFFYPQIVQFLTAFLPIPAHAHPLVFFSPAEGLVAIFKLIFWAGVLLSAPFWLFTLLRFIQPALHEKEKISFPLFIISSFFFIGAGILLAIYFTIPYANVYLYAFNASLGTNLWGFSTYIDYVLLLFFSHGIAFELGLFLLFSIQLRLLNRNTLRKKRRHAFVISLILGAFLTPPDVLTQLFIALPLYALFELAILYGAFIELLHEPSHFYHVHRDKAAIHPQEH